MILNSTIIDLNNGSSQDLLSNYQGEAIVIGFAIHSFSEIPNEGDASRVDIYHNLTNRPYGTLGLSMNSKSRYDYKPVNGYPQKICNGEGMYAKVDTPIGFPCTATVDVLGYPLGE
jgi:hypothetical protein